MLTKANSTLSILFSERVFDRVYKRVCCAMVHNHAEYERLLPYYMHYESVMVLYSKVKEPVIGV